jgi:hypothetical protein
VYSSLSLKYVTWTYAISAYIAVGAYFRFATPKSLVFRYNVEETKGKCLNEHQRCQIILKLSKTNAPNKRAFTWEYNVSKGAMRKVWDNREAILE